jgi:phosphate/sulfate permease
MEHLIEEIFFLQDKIFLRGFVFGLVHVGIMLIGFYTGWSINRLLKIISSGFIAGIIGVVIAHVIADYIAATLDPDIRSAALGIVVGGLLPLILIPFLEKYITKSKYHIAIGDHEELKKDLKKKTQKINFFPTQYYIIFLFL